MEIINLGWDNYFDLKKTEQKLKYQLDFLEREYERAEKERKINEFRNKIGVGVHITFNKDYDFKDVGIIDWMGKKTFTFKDSYGKRTKLEDLFDELIKGIWIINN